MWGCCSQPDDGRCVSPALVYLLCKCLAVRCGPSIDYIMPSWLYINPRATHRLTRARLGLFRANNPHGTVVDDFADDDY